MCGRFTLGTDTEYVQTTFSIDHVAATVKPSYNIAPTQPVMTVLRRDDKNVLEAMRWGMIPAWAKEMEIGSKMINARVETVMEKPTYKRPLKSQRCLIVADGFYEWQKNGAEKIPMFIHLKSKEPFAFAGLYDVWKAPSGEPITSCTIITTSANELMEPIHNRMPVILPKRAYKRWLDPSSQDLDALVALLQPYPSEELEAYAVSRSVNSPKNNSPELIRPVE